MDALLVEFDEEDNQMEHKDAEGVDDREVMSHAEMFKAEVVSRSRSSSMIHSQDLISKYQEEATALQRQLEAMESSAVEVGGHSRADSTACSSVGSSPASTPRYSLHRVFSRTGRTPRSMRSTAPRIAAPVLLSVVPDDAEPSAAAEEDSFAQRARERADRREAEMRRLAIARGQICGTSADATAGSPVMSPSPSREDELRRLEAELLASAKYAGELGVSEGGKVHGKG